MKYYFYIDETGDHGLTTVNPDFPIFLLCGVLISSDEYGRLNQSFEGIKKGFWGDKAVIFHSRDIRKCEKEFSILFDLDKKKLFYEAINDCVVHHDYVVVASAIRKDKYILEYGKLSDDVYEMSLSFIVERVILCLDDMGDSKKELAIIIERRGKKEDKKLEEHFQRLLARGTGYVSSERLKAYNPSIEFKSKKENINGLQMADLVAYPTARYVIEPNRANPAFDLIEPKIYAKGEKRHGLKVFP